MITLIPVYKNLSFLLNFIIKLLLQQYLEVQISHMSPISQKY